MTGATWPQQRVWAAERLSALLTGDASCHVARFTVCLTAHMLLWVLQLQQQAAVAHAAHASRLIHALLD
jgi:hypothetical protein